MKPFKSTKYRSSFETSLSILATIGKYGEYAQYDLDEAIGKDYRTVLRHLKLLEFNGFITLKRTEQARKKGKEKKIYMLAAFGLLQLLKFSQQRSPESFAEMVDELAEKNKSLLPLVFGKWDFFTKHKLIPYVTTRLEYASKMQPDYLESMVPEKALDSTPPEKEEKKEAIKIMGSFREFATESGLHRWYFHVFFVTGYGPEDAALQVKLFSILKKDRDLRIFIDSEFDYWQNQYEKQLSNLMTWRRTWQKISGHDQNLRV